MWSLGTLVWPPVCAVLVATALIVARVMFRKYHTETFEPGIFKVLAIVALSSAAVLVAGTAVAMYPYQAQYHRWEQTDGTVAKVSSRLLGGDNSITQRFVVRFDDGRERACDDTRCSLLKPGDHLTLSCKREWQYAGEDGWSCNYVRRSES